MEKSKEYKEILNLIKKGEGEKAIYKKIKRAFEAKKINEADIVELGNLCDNRETSNFDTNGELKESTFKIKDSEIETTTEILKIIKVKHSNNQEQLEIAIQQAIITLFFTLTLTTKEMDKGDFHKYINNLSSFDRINIMWLCENALYFCKDIITEEEHNFYIKKLIEDTQKRSSTTEINIEKMIEMGENFFDDIRNTNTISKYQFMNEDTILRDFKIICESKFYGTKREWSQKNEIAGAFNEPNHFKSMNDWQWLEESIDNLKDTFTELLERFEDSEDSIEELEGLADRYCQLAREQY